MKTAKLTTKSLNHSISELEYDLEILEIKRELDLLVESNERIKDSEREAIENEYLMRKMLGQRGTAADAMQQKSTKTTPHRIAPFTTDDSLADDESSRERHTRHAEKVSYSTHNTDSNQPSSGFTKEASNHSPKKPVVNLIQDTSEIAQHNESNNISTQFTHDTNAENDIIINGQRVQSSTDSPSRGNYMPSAESGDDLAEMDNDQSEEILYQHEYESVLSGEEIKQLKEKREQDAARKQREKNEAFMEQLHVLQKQNTTKTQKMIESIRQREKTHLNSVKRQQKEIKDLTADNIQLKMHLKAALEENETLSKQNDQLLEQLLNNGENLKTIDRLHKTNDTLVQRNDELEERIRLLEKALAAERSTV